VTTHRRLAAVLSLGFVAGCTAFAAHAGSVDKTIDVVLKGTVHQTLYAIGFDGQRGIAVGAGGGWSLNDSSWGTD